MQYPAIPRDELKSVKIKTTQYDKIKQLRLDRFSIKYIAELYNVTQGTIKYILNPELYEQKKAYNRRYLNDRLKQDIKFKKKRKKQGMELLRLRLKTDQKFRQYQYQFKSKQEYDPLSSKKYRECHPIKIKEDNTFNRILRINKSLNFYYLKDYE